MGILDDAIRDHLALKRQAGTAQSDLQRLEDEAFGPPSRPGDPPSDSSPALAVATDPGDAGSSGVDEASRPPSASAESAVLQEPPGLEEPTVLDQQAPPPAPDVPDAPQVDKIAVEPGVDVDSAAEGPAEMSDMPAFHDFAAEEGLVAEGPAPAPPAEPQQAPPPEPQQEAPEAPTQREPEPPPQREPEPTPPPMDDTQPHDMAAEIHTPEGNVVPSEEPAAPSDEVDIDSELDLDLGEEEELRPESVLPDAPPPRPEPPADSGRLEVAEEDDEDVEEEDEELLDDDDVEIVEDDDEELEGEGEDVLEETPEFLRETPEHDRLWFEQRPPKDFDFEED